MTHRLLALLLPLALATACASTKTAGDGASTDPPAVSAEAEADEPAPFDVEVADWEGKAGDDALIVVIVKAKNGFKINAEYPHKVVLDAPPEGVTLAATTIRKADAEVEGEKSIRYAITATTASAGDYDVTGTVKLSVCNEEQCRMAKERVTARLAAR